MQIKRVSIREFNQNISGMLQQLPLILTKHGKDVATITKCCNNAKEDVATTLATDGPTKKVTVKIRSPKDIKKEVIERSKAKFNAIDCVGITGIMNIPTNIANNNPYGCGCKREEARLCPKHGRI